MKRQNGFTLIELIVVIVILGILAVTAAPKFLGFQGDARKASLQGLKGAIDGGASIAYGRAAIEGLETNGGTTTSGGIPIVFGYPKATSAALSKVVNGLDDWLFVSEGSNKITYSYAGNSDTSECYVEYTEASDANTPAKTRVELGSACQ